MANPKNLGEIALIANTAMTGLGRAALSAIMQQFPTLLFVTPEQVKDIDFAEIEKRTLARYMDAPEPLMTYDYPWALSFHSWIATGYRIKRHRCHRTRK